MRNNLLEGVKEAVAVKEEKLQSKVKRPPLYKVILLNDNYTPMDFVVSVLQEFFFMEENKAIAIMLAVHYQGKAICGTYTYDVAETKMSQINGYARVKQHPLLCIIESES